MNRDSLVNLMFATMPLVQRKLVQGIEGNEITKQNLQILHLVCEEPGRPIGYYSDKMVISKPNFSKTVNKLIVKEELLRREFDHTDRRVTRLYITNKGEEVLKNKLIELKSFILKKISPLSDDEIEILKGSYQNIFDILDKL